MLAGVTLPPVWGLCYSLASFPGVGAVMAPPTKAGIEPVVSK